MRRKITSILNVDSKEGKLKIGTIDKKNPSVMFIEGGFYIMPLASKDNYKNDVNIIKKELKEIIKENINNSSFYKPEHMFFIEFGDEKIVFNKKTYFTFQIFLKPKSEILGNKGFVDLMKIINNNEQWLHIVKSNLEKNGFIVTKTKN